MVNQLGVSHADALTVGELGALNTFIVDKGTVHAHVFEGENESITGEHGVLWGNIRIWKDDLRFKCRASNRDGWAALFHELIQNEFRAL